MTDRDGEEIEIMGRGREMSMCGGLEQHRGLTSVRKWPSLRIFISYRYQYIYYENPSDPLTPTFFFLFSRALR